LQVVARSFLYICMSNNLSDACFLSSKYLHTTSAANLSEICSHFLIEINLNLSAILHKSNSDAHYCSR